MVISKDVLKKELELAHEEFYRYPVFREIEDIIELMIRKNFDRCVEIIHEADGTPKAFIYSYISNISGDMIESGQYHIYRSVLSKNGEDLLHIFDKSMDILIEIDSQNIDHEYVEKQKSVIRENIKMVG